jgi:Kef-type K+ transport system membrane component KefB
VSGFVGGKLLGFSKRESLIIGFASIPQLSTTLAVAFIAVEFGMISQELAASLVVLSTITTFVAPLAIKFLVTKDMQSNKGTQVAVA